MPCHNFRTSELGALFTSCFILFRCVHQVGLQLIIKKETGDAHRQPPPPRCSAQESHQQPLQPELRVTPVPQPPAAASVGDTAADRTPGETGERWQGRDRANQKDSAHLGDPSEHSDSDHRQAPDSANGTSAGLTQLAAAQRALKASTGAVFLQSWRHEGCVL